MIAFQHTEEQVFPLPVNLVWEFISNPANLAKITPEYMGFDILTSELPAKIYPGMIVQYRIRPILNIPFTWVTEITHAEENKYFIDIQRSGPYKFWHHQHILTETSEGTHMKDIVSYLPPLGPIGKLANRLFIQNQLNEIFGYRRLILDKHLGRKNENVDL